MRTLLGALMLSPVAWASNVSCPTSGSTPGCAAVNQSFESTGPITNGTSFQIDAYNVFNSDAIRYTGDQTNWISVSCGTSTDQGGYSYCGGEILGDFLPPSNRAAVTSPSLPFNGNGYQFDILNLLNKVIGIYSINPSGGCPLGTCGVFVQFLTSPNGGPLSSQIINDFASIPVSGSAVANGTLQTAFTLVWSDGRTDAIDFDYTTPEPSAFALFATGLLAAICFRSRLTLKDKK